MVDPSISSIIQHVSKTEAFQKPLSLIAPTRQVVFDHTAGAGVPFLTALCIHKATESKRIWVLTPHIRAQENLASQLDVWGIKQVLFLPEKEISLGDELGDPEISAERLNTLHRIAKGSFGQQVIVLTEASLNHDVPAAQQSTHLAITLRTGQQIDPADLEKQLSVAGFEEVAQVIARGQWSRRGGILDIFPLQAAHPLRFDFFDDEIDSIREFDVDSQVSFSKKESADLILINDAQTEPLRQWIQPDDLIITTPYCKEAGHVAILSAPLDEAEGIEDFSTAIYETPLGNFEAGDFVMQEARRALAERQIDEWYSQGWMVHIFFPNKLEEDRFRCICEENAPHLLTMNFVHGSIPAGFSLPGAKTVILSSSELFGRYQTPAMRLRASREDKARKIRAQAFLKDINPGDLVVHSTYGIGKFICISTSDDTGDDEMHILYKNNTHLHVPLSQAHLVSRYIGLGNKAPTLNSLADNKWQRAKKNAERSVSDYAAQLLSIQAERQATKGYSHPPDSKWMWEFESSFPFRETPDQLRAILQTKADMESDKPMDRLICGDVGFGKTEVAIRAAFKAVTGGRQVAMLVPTTVLAEQHFRTFKARMSEYPIRIELLSRFASQASINSTLRGLIQGSVDIVIGTHRLISDDVCIKNLGLVIIDEEQRFGVRHKERFKERFKGIDVLTLSATPIPRTLYSALMGARDMSSIETPPVNRHPVQTSVCPYDERIIKKAMERELARGGQIFFLHNRVRTIEHFRDKIQTLVPQARIVIGHGQMDKHELEKVMSTFVKGDADVLLATSIIESGIDIPNANTIIIDRADCFGLADLYQLRGRVGRGGQHAYAYLMLPRSALTTSDARKRVSAIKQYSALGSGFKIAMRDLEIRGAGNLLGTQQSGHIAAIGFELYCQLLQQSIAQINGKALSSRIETSFRADFLVMSETRLLSLDARSFIGAFVPKAYISDPGLRISAYKELACAQSIKELAQIQKFWVDRFGKIPTPVSHLLTMHKIRIIAAKNNISAVEISEQKLKLTRNDAPIMLNGRFPRLESTKPSDKLNEALSMLQML